jgi:hypothetical protein
MIKNHHKYNARLVYDDFITKVNCLLPFSRGLPYNYRVGLTFNGIFEINLNTFGFSNTTIY